MSSFHISRHTNNKPYACVECGKKFGRSDYLLKHMRVHRKNEKQDIIEEEEEEDVNTLLSEAMLEPIEPMEYVLQD